MELAPALFRPAQPKAPCACKCRGRPLNSYVRLKRVRSYRYLQWVESVRAEDKPRQRVWATLGRVEKLQAEGSIDALLSSLSRFSPNALALIAGESSPDTQALTIGPGLIFERLWQRLKPERILKALLCERHFGFEVERAIFSERAAPDLLRRFGPALASVEGGL